MEHFILNLLRTPRGECLLSVASIALGLMFCLIAYQDIRDAQRLRNTLAKVDAEVVETRISHGQHFETYHDLRYRFQVAGRPEYFTREEPGTGRTDLWTSLPQPDWDAARTSGRIAVVYLLENPRINRAVASEAQSASDSLAGGVIGALMVLGGAVGLVGLTVRRVANPAPAQ